MEMQAMFSMLIGFWCCIRAFFASSAGGKITLLTLGILALFPSLAGSLLTFGAIAFDLAWTHGAVTLFIVIAAIYITDWRLSS